MTTSGRTLKKWRKEALEVLAQLEPADPILMAERILVLTQELMDLKLLAKSTT